MGACDLAAAAGCNSFSYNPQQRKCFLKAGPSADTCQVSRWGRRARVLYLVVQGELIDVCMLL